MENLGRKCATTLATALALLATAGCWWSEASRAHEKAEDALPQDTSTRIDFDLLPERYSPAGFSFARTGGGDMGAWRVDRIRDSSNNVLAQISADGTDSRYPVCVYDGFSAADVAVSCRFKTVDGRVDRAAGLVARYVNEQNYYVVRANALEGNVRLYRVVAGVRKQIAGADSPVDSGRWHDLALHVTGNHFEVVYENKLLFSADDAALTGEGKVGLWTKADSVTWFDDLRFKALEH